MPSTPPHPCQSAARTSHFISQGLRLLICRKCFLKVLIFSPLSAVRRMIKEDNLGDVHKVYEHSWKQVVSMWRTAKWEEGQRKRDQ